MAKVIGITGGVGSGKSLVIDYLKKRYPYTVIKADEVAHLVKEKGGSCYESLIDLLGGEVLAPNGEINREKMAELIFQDKQLLKKINELIHPAVKEYILDAIEREKGTYIFIEAALLIEDGYLPYLEELWYIYAKEEIRTKRLMDARGYSKEKIERIYNMQLEHKEYRKYSDYTIDNSTTTEDLFEQITSVMNGKTKKNYSVIGKRKGYEHEAKCKKEYKSKYKA